MNSKLSFSYVYMVVTQTKYCNQGRPMNTYNFTFEEIKKFRSEFEGRFFSGWARYGFFPKTVSLPLYFFNS